VTLVGAAGYPAGSLNRERASQVAGGVALLIAAAVLASRWVGPPLLSSWGTGLPAMTPVGACCLAALGVAQVFAGRDWRIATATGTTVAALATVLLAAAFLHVDIGLERLTLHSPARQDGLVFRVVHTATLAFVLTGAALALSPFDRYRPAATVLAGVAAAIAVFALLGYLTGIDTLYGAAAVASPPLPTAAGLFCVACGILLRAGAMPALRTPRPLWQFLALLGGAILVPLLLFGAYAEISIADAELVEVSHGLMRGAQVVSTDLERQISSEIERLKALAASPSLRQGDLEAFQHQAEASLAPRGSGDIALIDRDLGVRVMTWMPYGTSTGRTAVPEIAATALATGRPQFTGLFVGPATRQLMFAVVVPVEIDGENRYVLIRSIRQQALAEPIASGNLPPGWQAAIANSGHQTLAQTLDTMKADGILLPQSLRRGGRPGSVFEFTDASGRTCLAAYAVSGLTGWETAVWAPKALLEAPVRALWRTLGLLALLSLGLITGLALWLGRIIARSVERAAQEVATTQTGTARAAETPVAEVNALMAELREASARRQAADALLRDSEHKLRLVTDSVPVVIARCDSEGRFTWANRLFKERYGLPLEQIVGKKIAEVIGDDAFAGLERHVAECLAGAEVECEFPVCGWNGRPMVVQGRFAPEWRDGEVVGLIGATTDITRLKKAEQRLRASEVTFRQLVDDSPFGIYVVDADFRIVQASVGARKAFADGVTPVIGRDLADAVRSIWPEPFTSDAIEHFRHTMATGEPYRVAGSVERRKDTGAVESYDWKIERLTMPDGRFGVVCHFYDLSERQKYEDALRESEATFRAMFDSSAVGKIEIETNTGRFLRANAAMCRFVGYSEEELLGRTVFDITHPDDRETDRGSLRSMDAGALPVFDKEKRYIRKDGQIVWARVTANTIRDAAGRPLRNTAVIQDLNARKRAEQELEASRTRLQLALDAARLGWFQYDPARRSGWGDTRFREICDFDAAEIPLDMIMERIHPDDMEKVRTSLATHPDPLNPPVVVEFRIRRRDGDIRWVELHGLAHFEGIGPQRRAVSLIGTAEDITERKQHEEQTQLLMREVNHRAKNMLSVVDAIAHQTAARRPEDFIERFSERIQALSANQDLLVRNEWKGVWVADLVRAQLAHFADLAGSRIVVHGPALRLNAASAQAIGLAIHELSTNAGKYGALSVDSGGVDIRWRIEDDTFHICWAESGGPPVSAPERRGFGTIVMETMAERTVGGNVELEYAPSGVTWRLSCPAANALDQHQ
jgi:PAS domain S-box-containing protein